MDTDAAAALHALWRDAGPEMDMRAMFADDPGRAARMAVDVAGLLRVDYSKNIADGRVLAGLLALADAAGVATRRDAMLAGAHINATEDRAALHVALRAAPFLHEPGDWAAGRFAAEAPAVIAQLDRMADMCRRVHSGAWRGLSGRRLRHVVNIGIGGSDLGPAMATAALAHCRARDDMTFHFVANVDGAALAEALAAIDLEAALFVVVSKTFTTAETMRNATSAADALVRHYGGDRDRGDVVAAHFAAVSTNTAALDAFGVRPENVAAFWDWVGGRYSVWSAAGLSLMLAIGPESFRDFLAGAHAVDGHFAAAAGLANAPLVLGLLDVWYASFVRLGARAVLPYEHALGRLPAYLQQADMESNGKAVRLDGRPVAWPTGAVVFGEPGTNGQHAFFQLLHQGTTPVPADFLLGLRPAAPSSLFDADAHHAMLVANCVAQAEALMAGGCTQPGNPHRVFPGNRPSTTIAYERLAPRVLGALLALYEHRVFVAGVVWGINSFDQWGVELGKQLAAAVQTDMARARDQRSAHDASTSALIDLCVSGHL